MSLTRKKSDIALTLKIIELLSQPTYLNTLDLQLKKLEKLLEQLEDPNLIVDLGTEKMPKPSTILIQAVSTTDSSGRILELVLNQLAKKTSFDINQVVRDPQGKFITPLVASLTYTKSARMLIQAGVDVRVAGDGVLSPLAAAIYLGCHEIIYDLLMRMLLTPDPAVDQRIFAEALVHIIIKNPADYMVHLNSIISVLGSTNKLYPDDFASQVLRYPVPNYDNSQGMMTVASVALRYGHAKAINSLKRWITDWSEQREGFCSTIEAAMISNLPISYLTLHANNVSLFNLNSMRMAMKHDADKFVQFAIQMMTRENIHSSSQVDPSKNKNITIEGISLMQLAVEFSAVKVVRLLLENGADVNEVDAVGIPLFWHAIQRVGHDFTSPAVPMGIFHQDNLQGENFCHVNKDSIIRNEDKQALEVVERFIQFKVDLAFIHPQTKQDYLMLAAQKNNYILSHMLFINMSQKIDLTRQDINNRTLVQVCASQLNINMLRLIVRYLNADKKLSSGRYSILDFEYDTGRTYESCMASFVISATNQPRPNHAILKFLSPDYLSISSVKSRQDILQLCEENVRTIGNQLYAEWLSQVRYFDVVAYVKALHELLAGQVDPHLNEKDAILPISMLSDLVRNSQAIFFQSEKILDSILSNPSGYFSDLSSQQSLTKNVVQAAFHDLSCVVIASHLHLSQFYITELSNVLVESMAHYFNRESVAVIHDLMKILRQISNVNLVIFDSLHLSPEAKYLFSNMHDLVDLVYCRFDEVNDLINDLNRSVPNRSKVVPAKAKSKLIGGFHSALSEKDQIEIDRNISAMLSATQEAPDSRSVAKKHDSDLLGTNLSGESVRPKDRDTETLAANPPSTIKRKKNKKSKRSKNIPDDKKRVEIPGKQSADSSDAILTETPKSILEPVITISPLMSDKIANLEMNIARRQKAWDESEAKKLFDKHRQLIESQIDFYRIINRSEQPAGVAEFEMKVKTEFHRVYTLLENAEPFYFVGGAVINFRQNIKFDATKSDIDIVAKIAGAKILNKFRLSQFVGTEFSDLYMYKSPDLDLDMVCYKPDAELDLTADCQNRDYTICAVYMNAKGYIDPTGHGLNDIDKRVLRAIGDPNQIKDDPVRFLRALKYILRGFEPEPNLRAVLLGMNKASFDHLDDQKANSLRVKGRIFLKTHGVDWRNVLAVYQLASQKNVPSVTNYPGHLFSKANQSQPATSKNAESSIRPTNRSSGQ